MFYPVAQVGLELMAILLLQPLILGFHPFQVEFFSSVETLMWHFSALESIVNIIIDGLLETARISFADHLFVVIAFL